MDGFYLLILLHCIIYYIIGSSMLFLMCRSSVNGQSHTVSAEINGHRTQFNNVVTAFDLFMQDCDRSELLAWFILGSLLLVQALNCASSPIVAVTTRA